MTRRLPEVGGDDGTWGTLLNDFLSKEHHNTGGATLSADHGGHKTITIRAGTAGAGGAPLKFTAGTNLTATESGAMEYDGGELYFTISDLTRRTIAMYDDTSGALGDIYYRNSTGTLTRLQISTSIYNFGKTLAISSAGLPSWDASLDIQVVASSNAPVGSSRQNEYYITALASGVTFSAPSGTPTNGNLLLIRIKDNGGAQTLGWNSIYRAIARALPTTTTASKTMYLGFKYNSSDSKWDMIAYAEEA